MLMYTAVIVSLPSCIKII